MADTTSNLAPIDIGAIRAFQNMWGPVLQVLPAIMDTVERKADIDRELAQSQQAVIDAQAVADANQKAALAALEGIKESIDSAIFEKAVVQKDIDNLQVVATAQRTAWAAEQDAANASFSNTMQDLNSKINALSTTYQNAEAAAIATHADMLVGFANDIAALEQRRAVAQSAMDALRSKLG